MYEIKGFEPRLYQQSIFNTCIKSNTLVVLPTGKGKTKLSILVAVHRLNNFPKSKILFLTPTKPLAAQICQEFKECTNIGNVNLFTGEIKPELRKELWQESDVVISTPQTITNDIINKNVNFSEISLLILDESHLATGDYDYVWLAKQYQQKSEFPRVVGLTASPGDNLESISEICNKLYIEDIEVRSLDDEDIKPYVYETKTDYILLELSEDLKKIKKYLDDCLKERLDKLKNFGLVRNIKYVSKTNLLGMQRELQQRVAKGDRDVLLWSSISLVAECLKAHHALEMLETQGVSSLSEYMNKLYKESKNTKVKSTKNLVIDTNFKSAYAKMNLLVEKKVEHPKLLKLKEIVADEVKTCDKILVFNHYRDSAAKLKEELNKLEGVKAELFVGQTKKKNTGLTQKKQIEMLENFKAGEFNVVIMTSVGELGLDIPSVDLIVFYEPVPSAIRQIQRRGRTSRHKEGKLKVLVTKGTRDEAYRWSAHHKEKRMYSVLKDLKSKLSLNVKQEKLSSFDSKLKIYADSRERGSAVIRNLVEKGVDVKVQNLDVGDFLVSERVCVERKSVLSDTPVIIRRNKKIEIEYIDKIYKKHKKKQKFSVMGIDVNLHKIDWYDVYDVTKHLTKEIYYISTSPKRKKKYKEEKNFIVGLTKGHSVYVFKNKKIQHIPSEKLKEGDFLITVPPILPEAQNKINFENFLKQMQSKCTKNYEIYNKTFRLTSSKQIYNIPNFDTHFFFMAGLWTAEGHYSERGLFFSQKDTKRNKIIEKNFKKVFDTYSINKGVYVAGGKTYYELFKKFGFKGGAANKIIPDLVFSTTQRNKAAFIRGYFFGDGWANQDQKRNSSQLKVLSKSKKLISGLSYLLYSLGIENNVGFDFTEYKNERRKYFLLNIKTKSFARFIKIVGQIPTKRIKINKRQNISVPYYFWIQNYKPLRRLTKREVIFFYQEVNKLKKVYDSLKNYLEKFKKIIKDSQNKKEFSKETNIKYSKIRNIANKDQKTTQTPIEIINLLRRKDNKEEIRINWNIIKKTLKKLRIKTYLKVYTKEIYSEGLIKEVYNKINKIIGYDSLFIISNIYLGNLFVEKIQEIRKETTKKEVFDLSVETSENFVGGLNPILLHNSTQDFVDSIIDKRLLHQLKMLKDSFEKPVLLIEGVEDIYSVRKVHANAIRGMLAYIAVDLGIPIVSTKDFRDTVDFLVAVAKREQEENKKEFGIRGERKPLTVKEQQEFVVSGFPGVGPTLAKGLLTEFGSVKGIVSASEAELKDVEKIGKKKAKEIRKVLDEKYKKII